MKNRKDPTDARLEGDDSDARRGYGIEDTEDGIDGG
jgi:hypothetical protein